MAENDWEDVPKKKPAGAGTATADSDWEDVSPAASIPSVSTPASASSSDGLDEYLKKPAAIAPEEKQKPGFWKRLGESVGAPTSMEELKASTPGVMETAFPAITAAKGLYGWGKRALGNVGEGLKEEYEAGRNIAEGGPVLANIGKATSGIVHGGIGSLPFIGEPIETAGKDVLENNYAGAAGGLTGVIGQVALPDIIAKTPEIARATTKATGGLGMGLGLPAEDLLTKAVRPRARAQGWQEALSSPGVQRAIKAADANTPITNIEDFHDAIGPMKENLWNEKVQPAISRQGPRPVDMKPAAQAVRDAITPEMREFNPGSVKDLETLADKLEKSRTVQEASDLQKYANAQLNSYFAKYPTARRAAFNTNPDTIGWESARRGIREQLNKTLEDAGETQTAESRKDYGHLTTIEKELERKVNPNERKAPINLARMLGLIGALPTAGTSILAGEVISHMNDPNVLLRRGIKRLNPPAEIPFTPPPAFVPPAPPAQISRPEEAPLFNLPQTAGRVPPLERLGGIQNVDTPVGLEQEGTLGEIGRPHAIERIGEAPKVVYRVQDIGSTELNPRSHAHATESLEEARKYLKGREAVQGKPQEIRATDMSKLAPENYEVFKGPNGHRWVKFKP